MMLDRRGIEARLPHAGAMCLLDGVVRWDASQIECRAPPPRPDHPLARDGRLPAIAAAEYAAQASAVHGALVEGRKAPRPGMLAKLSELELRTSGIGGDCDALRVHAVQLAWEASACLYAFEVFADEILVARGRLMAVFPSEDAS